MQRWLYYSSQRLWKSERNNHIPARKFQVNWWSRSEYLLRDRHHKESKWFIDFIATFLDWQNNQVLESSNDSKVTGSSTTEALTSDK